MLPKYCDYQKLCRLYLRKWFWNKHGKKSLKMYQISEEKRNFAFRKELELKTKIILRSRYGMGRYRSIKSMVKEVETLR